MADGNGAYITGDINSSRISRYAKVNFEGITVRKAVTKADFKLVGQLRQTGFSRVADQYDAKWVDDIDQSPGVFSLIAYNSLNQPVATIRVQDGRISLLELSRFVPIDSILHSNLSPIIQGSRLSVIKALQATDAMFALFKSVWLWCLREEIKSIVIATPPWARPIYEFLSFDDLGPMGNFLHQLIGVQHISMAIPVNRPIVEWPVIGHPLSGHFNHMSHPELMFEY